MASARSATWWRGDESAAGMRRDAARSVPFGFADRLLRALEPDPRVGAVAEWLLRRAAAAAEGDRVAGHGEFMTVGVDQAQGALHEVRTVRTGLDGHLVHVAPPWSAPIRPGNGFGYEHGEIGAACQLDGPSPRVGARIRRGML